MLPVKCKQDVLRLLEEQMSKRILLIFDESDGSKELFRYLSSNYKSFHFQTASFSSVSESKIETPWDSIVVSNVSLYKNGDFPDKLKKLLTLAKQSVVVVGPMYTRPDNEPADIVSGIRYLYPTRFSDYDFTYQRYMEPQKWQIFNFYAKNHSQNEVESDKRIAEAVAAGDACKKIGRKLNVVYALPHLSLTGGLKYLLVHAKCLHALGHNVYLMCIGAENAIPSWSSLTADDITGQIHASPDNDIDALMREKKIDVIVAGFYNQLALLSKCSIPVLYWEQGCESLYGDMGTVLSCNSPSLAQLRSLYSLPVTIASVSPVVSKVLSARYGRVTPLLYTGIDTDFYTPLNAGCTKAFAEKPKILLVGSPGYEFKGFTLILNVLTHLWNNGLRFEVTWASQTQLTARTLFPLKIMLTVPQKQLAELYRTHDIFISASTYESFPMPPMEAFASGTAVVSTDNGGINVYAKPGKNILLAEQGNFLDLYVAVKYLLENPEKRDLLARNAREDALEFSVKRTICQLENLLYAVAASGKTVTAEKESASNVDSVPVQKEQFSLEFEHPISSLPGYSTLQKMVETGEGLEAVVEFEKQKSLVSRLDVLKNMCKGKSVIHIGCTDHIPLIKRKMTNGTWLHGILTESCSEVLGLDINETAINYVKNIGYKNVYYGDITKPKNENITENHWDYMLFAEMIEHLPDPVGFLKSVSDNYSGYVDHFIITVPNAFGLPFLAMALNNGQERVNPDHKAWYTPYTMLKLLYSAGFQTESIFTCAYENSIQFLKQNESLVLQKPILQDTIVAVFKK